MDRIISPEEFRAEMEKIKKDGDPEIMHGSADVLMCDVLVSLGYGEGVEIYNNMTKWYA